MLEEIKAGAKLEFSLGSEESGPSAFMLVWYDGQNRVDFARIVSYGEMQDFLDSIYPNEGIEDYMNKQFAMWELDYDIEEE